MMRGLIVPRRNMTVSSRYQELKVLGRHARQTKFLSDLLKEKKYGVQKVVVYFTDLNEENTV